MPTPRLLKGALTYAGTQAGSAQPVMFQFNPETLARLQVYSEHTNSITETIRFKLILNAMDGMEQELLDVVENGIYPQIAALEALLEQQSKQQRTTGWPDWLFPSRNAPFLVLIYGERIIPVTIQRLNIKERLHNSQLKPIHATVDITLRVLTERELRGNVEGLMVLTRYKQYRHLKARLADTRIQ